MNSEKKTEQETNFVENSAVNVDQDGLSRATCPIFQIYSMQNLKSD